MTHPINTESWHSIEYTSAVPGNRNAWVCVSPERVADECALYLSEGRRVWLHTTTDTWRGKNGKRTTTTTIEEITAPFGGC